MHDFSHKIYWKEDVFSPENGLTTCSGVKKVIFKSCHSGKLKLLYTSPNVISAGPKNFWWAKLISRFFCNLISSRNLTFLPIAQVKRTKFTSSPIAKSTSPGHYILCTLLLLMTSYLITIATDHHWTCVKMCTRDEWTATENVRYWCFIL